jgi:hypothetical protein
LFSFPGWAFYQSMPKKSLFFAGDGAFSAKNIDFFGID